jgi:hypothetical protein
LQVPIKVGVRAQLPGLQRTFTGSDEFREQALALEQFVVIANFDDASVIEYQDQIAVLQGAQPVRNNDRRTIAVRGS